MGKQNSLRRMIMNSRLVYIDGKTSKDINTMKPEIDFKEICNYDLEEDYEIVFYDKQEGVLKLEKYDKDKKVLYSLCGLSPEQLINIRNGKQL